MEKPDRSAEKRLSIGLLIDQATAYYQMNIILGAVEAAKANGVNLVCIEGGCIHSKHDHHARQNFVYDLVSEGDFDGILLLSSVCRFAEPAQILEFRDRFRPLPIVSIAYQIEGCGNILIDDATGLCDLLKHLIEYHHFRRFAVILGPAPDQNVQKRFATIRKTFDEYGIILDDNLITSGDFLQNSGALAVKTFLDERKAEFDVLLSTNDGMAWGALDELRSRGVKVPRDMAVAGYDNFFFSAYSSPPLTTVNHSLFDQGVQSVNLLLEMIREDAPPRDVYVPTKLVIRESCGCLSQASSMSALDDIASTRIDSNTLSSENKNDIIRELLQKVRSSFPTQNIHPLEELLEQLVTALNPHSEKKAKDEFITDCYEILRHNLLNNDDIFLWQTFISEIRHGLLPHITDANILIRMEAILHQVRVMAAEKSVEKEKMGFHESLQNNLILNSISEELLTAVEPEKMMDTLAEKLPQLGISTGFIATFTGKRRTIINKRQLLLAFNQNGRIKETKSTLYSDRLIPDKLTEDEEPHALLISSLHRAENPLGLMALEINSLNGAGVYDALRRIISGSLNGAILARKVKEQEKNLVAQREHLKNLAETRRTMETFVLTLLQTIELKDPYTAGHQNRSAELAQAIAIEMGLSAESVEGIRMAGAMHDLGKISVPTEVLVKPTKLNEVEIALIREHPKTAYEILKNINFPWPVALPILQHHERLDGSGYPYGLKGGAISLEGKILAVADVIEAMASHRPYRPSLGIDQALHEIIKNRNVLYDPDVVDACIRLFQEKGYTLV